MIREYATVATNKRVNMNQLQMKIFPVSLSKNLELENLDERSFRIIKFLKWRIHTLIFTFGLYKDIVYKAM